MDKSGCVRTGSLHRWTQEVNYNNYMGLGNWLIQESICLARVKTWVWSQALAQNGGHCILCFTVTNLEAGISRTLECTIQRPYSTWNLRSMSGHVTNKRWRLPGEWHLRFAPDFIYNNTHLHPILHVHLHIYAPPTCTHTNIHMCTTTSTYLDPLYTKKSYGRITYSTLSYRSNIRHTYLGFSLIVSILVIICRYCLMIVWVKEK